MTLGETVITGCSFCTPLPLVPRLPPIGAVVLCKVFVLLLVLLLLLLLFLLLLILLLLLFVLLLMLNAGPPTGEDKDPESASAATPATGPLVEPATLLR